MFPHILLIVVGDASTDERLGLPVGIAQLKAVLRNAGYSVKCYDATIHPFNQKDFYKFLEKEKPAIIGLSSTAFFIKELKKYTRMIKSYSIEINVVIGGYCSLVDNILSITGADVVCHGEGDECIIEIVKALLSPIDEKYEKLKKIQGISYQTLSGDVIINKPRPLIEDLNKIPFPDFSDLPFNEYTLNSWVPMYTQRGCYNHCKFCDIFPFYRSQRIRSMDPERIVNYISEMYLSNGHRYFLFNDDNFLSSKKFVENFTERLLNSGLEGKIFINFQTRIVDIIRFKSYLRKIKKFIFSIELGVESFSDTQLKRYSKNTIATQNLEAIEILKDLNIPMEIFYMFLDEKTTIEELEINIKTILNLGKIPYQELNEPIPEIVVNYQYNVWCDLVGRSTIEGIDYLEVFEYFLEETENIQKLFIIYRSIQKLIEEYENHNLKLNDSFQENLLYGFKNTFLPQIQQLGYSRLKIALELSKKVNEKKLHFQKKIKSKKKDKKNKNRSKNLTDYKPMEEFEEEKIKCSKSIKKQIKDFNKKINQLLQPFKKMGLDISSLGNSLLNQINISE